jgi:hypothetical protein
MNSLTKFAEFGSSVGVEGSGVYQKLLELNFGRLAADGTIGGSPVGMLLDDVVLVDVVLADVVLVDVVEPVVGADVPVVVPLDVVVVGVVEVSVELDL